LSRYCNGLGLAQTYSSTSWDSSCTVVYICSSAHLRQSIQRSSSPLSSSGYTVTDTLPLPLYPHDIVLFSPLYPDDIVPFSIYTEALGCRRL
jgi:hypothetical protein